MVVQGIFILDGLDNHLAAALESQLGHHAGLVAQQGVDVVHALGTHTVNGGDDITLLDVHAGLQQRRAQLVAVGSAAQDLGNLVAACHLLQLSTQHADVVLVGLDVVATVNVGMTHSQLANHAADDVGEVQAVLDVGQQGGILVVHRLPVHAVHVLEVEAVAIVAPGLVENLVPLLVVVDRGNHVVEVHGLAQVGLAGRQGSDVEVVTLHEP